MIDFPFFKFSVETHLTVYELFNDKKQNLQTLCSNLCGIYGENDKYCEENEFGAIRIKNTLEMEDMALSLTIFDLKKKIVQDKSIKGISKITDFELLYSLSNNDKFIILDNEIRLSQISLLNKLTLFALFIMIIVMIKTCMATNINYLIKFQIIH